MGGGYYDRDVSSTSSSKGFSTGASEALSRSYADSTLLPGDRHLHCKNKSPVVVAIDVTGSMGDWAKIIWDKMPMFYGQIMMQGYLEDPAVSFAAIGDANCDSYPVQVCDFAQGNDLDDWLSRVFLEGGGGGQGKESYELMAYFYSRRVTIDHPKGFFFITGDEDFYPVVEKDHAKELFNEDLAEPVQAEMLFKELARNFHVFLIHKTYGSPDTDRGIRNHWARMVGKDRVLQLDDPKAVVDLMLGAISITIGTRSLDQYIDDMAKRGQTAQRQKVIRAALGTMGPSEALVDIDTEAVKPTSATVKRSGRSKRTR